MFDRGYLKIATIRGVPIRLHWTLPIGALFFSQFRFVPAFWFSFTLIIFIHEFGHATLVRRFGHRTIAIDITGIGGLCRWSGNASGFERSAIAWGGVLAQSILLLGALAYVGLLGWPANVHALHAVDAFITTNIFLIGFNLIPFPPFDGAEAWQIMRHGRFANLVSSLRSSLSKAKPKRKPGKRAGPRAQVIDLEDWARRQGRQRKNVPAHDVAHDVRVGKGSAKDVADELIRISEEAAKARKKRTEN